MIGLRWIVGLFSTSSGLCITLYATRQVVHPPRMRPRSPQLIFQTEHGLLFRMEETTRRVHPSEQSGTAAIGSLTRHVDDLIPQDSSMRRVGGRSIRVLAAFSYARTLQYSRRMVCPRLSKHHDRLRRCQEPARGACKSERRSQSHKQIIRDTHTFGSIRCMLFCWQVLAWGVKDASQHSVVQAG